MILWRTAWLNMHLLAVLATSMAGACNILHAQGVMCIKAKSVQAVTNEQLHAFTVTLGSEHWNTFKCFLLDAL